MPPVPRRFRFALLGGALVGVALGAGIGAWQTGHEAVVAGCLVAVLLGLACLGRAIEEV